MNFKFIYQFLRWVLPEILLSVLVPRVRVYWHVLCMAAGELEYTGTVCGTTCKWRVKSILAV